MFTKEEREEIGKLIKLGFVDSFRQFSQESGNYTWWPYGNSARGRNLGWRIDYIFTSKTLTTKLKNARIYPGITASDHCPTVESSLPLTASVRKRRTHFFCTPSTNRVLSLTNTPNGWQRKGN